MTEPSTNTPTLTTDTPNANTLTPNIATTAVPIVPAPSEGFIERNVSLISLSVFLFIIFLFGLYVYGKNVAPAPNPIVKEFGVTLISNRGSGPVMNVTTQQVILPNQPRLSNPSAPVISVGPGIGDVNSGWLMSSVLGGNPNIVSLENSLLGKFPNFLVKFPSSGVDGLLTVDKENPGLPTQEGNNSWFEITTTNGTKIINVMNPPAGDPKTRTVATTFITFRSIAQSTENNPKYLMVGPGFFETNIQSIIVDTVVVGTSDYIFELIN